MLKLNEMSSNYFSPVVVHPDNSTYKNAKDIARILSYTTLIVPAAMGALYGVSELYKRVQASLAYSDGITAFYQNGNIPASIIHFEKAEKYGHILARDKMEYLKVRQDEYKLYLVAVNFNRLQSENPSLLESKLENFRTSTSDRDRILYEFLSNVVKFSESGKLNAKGIEYLKGHISRGSPIFKNVAYLLLLLKFDKDEANKLYLECDENGKWAIKRSIKEYKVVLSTIQEEHKKRA